MNLAVTIFVGPAANRLGEGLPENAGATAGLSGSARCGRAENYHTAFFSQQLAIKVAGRRVELIAAFHAAFRAKSLRPLPIGLLYSPRGIDGQDQSARNRRQLLLQLLSRQPLVWSGRQ